jgi:PKD repeat protein
MLKIKYLAVFILIISIYSPVYTASNVAVFAKINVQVNQSDTSVAIVNKCSKNAKQYSIDYGDGIIENSSEYKDYNHKYLELGKYTITMVVLVEIKDEILSDTTKVIVEFTEKSVECSADFNFTVNDYEVTVINNSPGSNKKLIWYLGDGSIIKNKQSFTHTYNRQGAYDVRLYVENKNIDCNSEVIKTVVISGNKNYPVSVFEYFIDTANNVVFTNKSLGENIKFQWTFGDGKTSEEENPTHKYSHAGVYKVYLKAIDNSGYTSKFFKSVRIPETDLSNIMPDFQFIEDPENDTVSFTNKSVGNGIESYRWDFGDGERSTLVSPAHVFKADGIYNVCLSVASKNSGKYNTICQNVGIGLENILLPDFSYIQNNSSIVFINEPNQVPDSIRWDFGDGENSTDMQPTHDYKVEGVFLVSLKYYFKGYAYEDLKIITTQVNTPNLIARFTYYKSDLKSGGSEVHFKSSVSGDVSRVKYVWDFGDGTKDSTSANPNHEYSSSGEYNVCLTVYNYETGSVDVSCNMVIIDSQQTSIKTDELNSAMLISPNPSNGNFNINLNLNKTENIAIALHDLSGKIVKNVYTGKLSKGQNTINVSVNLKKGIYICKVTNSENVNSQLLLIY